MAVKKTSIVLNGYHILMDGLFDSFPIVLSFIVIGFGASEKAVGSMLSMAFVVTTLAGLSTIYLSHRWGLLRTVALITLCFAVGYVGNAFSSGLYMTGFFCIIALAGHGVFHNIAFAYLTRSNSRSVLGKTMGDFTLLGDVGRIPFVSFAGYLAAISVGAVAGWRIVCLLYGVLALGGCVYALYLARGAKGTLFSHANEGTATSPEDPSVEIKARRFPSFALLRDGQVRLAMLTSSLDAFCSDRLFAFLPFLLLAKGVEPTIVGTFAMAFTVGSLVGKFVCGRMVDAFGNRRVFILCEVLMAGLVIVLLLSQQVWCIVVAAILLGGVTRGTVPIIQTIITEPVTDSSKLDDVFAINSLLRGGINIVSPLIFGFLASSAGIEVVYALMSIVAVLAVIPILFLSPSQ